MAIIQFEDEEREIPDGSAILLVCEEMGMAFGCHDGQCGTCLSTIIEGSENLEPLNEKEKDYGLADGERLACQCIVKFGTVELSQ